MAEGTNIGDKVVVVTGASGGIGAALAERLAARGDTLVLAARRAGALTEVAGRCGGRAHVVVADVTRREDVRRVVTETLARAGRIDVWVNNAGQGIWRAPSELTDEDVDRMMRVNVLSALYGMQEVLPHFTQRGTGHVINVSSMLGRVPFVVNRAAYNGAKHFMNALTANFRTEVQEKFPGIQISVVSPGIVATDFGRHAMHGGPDSHQMPYAQAPGEVAEVIAGVIDTRLPDVYTRAGAHDQVVQYYERTGVDRDRGL